MVAATTSPPPPTPTSASALDSGGRTRTDTSTSNLDTADGEDGGGGGAAAAVLISCAVLVIVGALLWRRAKGRKAGTTSRPRGRSSYQHHRDEMLFDDAVEMSPTAARGSKAMKKEERRSIVEEFDIGEI